MDKEFNMKSTFIELNGDLKSVVNKEESMNKKKPVNFKSSTLGKHEPADHIVVLRESEIDGSDSQRNHVIRYSIAHLTETIHEKAHAINTTENVIKLIKFSTVVKLVVVFCVMVVLFSGPVVLFVTKSPAMESYIISTNFDSCKVSE